MHPFAAIFGFKATHLRFDFVLQHLLQRVVLARVHRVLRRRDRYGRALAQTFRQLSRFCLEVFGRYGCTALHVELTDHSGHLGALFLFRKPG